MKGNIGYSIFFVLAFGVAWAAFWFAPKSKEKLKGSVWLVLSFLFTLFAGGLVAGVVGLSTVKMNIFTMGIVYLVIGIVVTVLFVRKDRYQRYVWDKFDIAVMVFLTFVSIILYWRVYGTHMAFVFKNSDGAVHIGNALYLVRNQKLSGMYFSSLYAAEWIEVFMPWLKNIELWRGFVLADASMLLLEIWVFFILIRGRMKGRLGKIVGVLACLFYVGGYPLLSYLSNFYYWGISVMIMGVILYLLGQFEKKVMDRRWTIFFLMLCNGCLFLTYMLITPVVWIASAAAIFVIVRREGRVIQWKNIALGLQLYLFPCVMGLYYCYFQWMVKSGTGVAGTLATNGGIYSELYYDFLWFLPAVLFGLIRSIKRKHLELEDIFFWVFLATLVVLLAGCYYGKVSPYYYYKFYYPMWMICWCIAVRGIQEMITGQGTATVVYLMMVGFLGLLSVSGMEKKILSSPYATATISPWYRSDDVFRIYWTNKENWSPASYYDEGLLELCDYIMGQENCCSWLLADAPVYYYAYMFNALSAQDTSPVYGWVYPFDVVRTELESGNCDYLILLHGTEIYEENREYFEKYEIVYENNLGYVIAL